jgi:transcriptional regulator with XRE-family HTH domain
MPKTIFGGDHQHLVEVLIQARKAADLTQAEVAERIGRDQTFVSLIERGQRRMDVIEFIKLAKALGVEPAELFGEVLTRVG